MSSIGCTFAPGSSSANGVGFVRRLVSERPLPSDSFMRRTAVVGFELRLITLFDVLANMVCDSALPLRSAKNWTRKIHEPEIEMGGGRVIRVGNKDRPMLWITFHFESEIDAIAAHKLLGDTLNKAVKVEWP